MAAGEGAEGGQQGMTRFVDEAGQAQRVARTAAQMDHRVQVAGEHEVGRVTLRVVAAGEGAEQPGLVHHVDAGLGRRVAGAIVVVAAHQGHGHIAVPRAPVAQRLQHRRRAARRGVQEVAQAHQALRPVFGDQCVQPRQVVARGAAGHGLAQRAVAGGLAQVQVGDEQRLARRPPQRVRGQQVQRLAGPVDGGVGGMPLAVHA